MNAIRLTVRNRTVGSDVDAEAGAAACAEACADPGASADADAEPGAAAGVDSLVDADSAGTERFDVALISTWRDKPVRLTKSEHYRLDRCVRGASQMGA